MKTKETRRNYSALMIMAASLVAGLPVWGQNSNTLSDEVKYVPLGIDILVPEGGPPGSEFLPAFAPDPLIGAPSVAVVLTEGLNGPASDVLWNQQGQFYFSSDNEAGQIPNFPTGLPIVAVLPETGALQDLGSYFGIPVGELFVSSDIEAPEPNVGLLGLAGVALAAFLRRRRA